MTRSVTDPRTDFEINALGTFNVLEAARAFAPEAAFLYSSTNKVYGGLEHVVVEKGGRWQYASMATGIAETEPLDFHSPYGCSKGAADQYVRDYARIYGMRTVCLRQSCIYGRRQFGVEDQGWVAWFTIATAKGQPIAIYGDGKQVRDVLFVDDLVDCFTAAIEKIDRVKGSVFNIGGGPENNQMSIRTSLHREAREALRPPHRAPLRGLAPGRPAHLRVRRLQGRARAGVAPAHLAGRGGRDAARLGEAEPRSVLSRTTRP